MPAASAALTLSERKAGYHSIGWVPPSNVAYPPGPLDFVMATPGNHRWHHSTVIAESNTNYGLVIALWDHVFGTFFSPRDRAAPEAIGIDDMPDFPTTYFAQFLTPFAWERLRARQPRGEHPVAAH